MHGDFDIHAITPEELLIQVNKAGGQRAFSRRHGIKRTTLQKRLYKLRSDPLKHRPAPQAREIMPDGGRRRFIISSAQDSSKIHEKFLDNLEAYADYLRADAPCEIMIGAYTYSKRLFEDHATSSNKVFFHERVKPYLVIDRVRIADRLDFCGEMNTLPTAENPLSGFHTYTRHRWGIFPHAKVQLASVPSMKHAPVKMVMTTGAITLPNYIPKKAGIKAAFHHIIGAVLVEVDTDGTFFCRHLIADDDGAFYDLDCHVSDGGVTEGHRVTALTPGDIHVAQIDPGTSGLIFGAAPREERLEGCRVWDITDPDETIVGILNPEYVFIHDVSDFRARNHHEIMDPHKRYEHHIHGAEDVETELREVSAFLDLLDRRFPDTLVTVVESNHDQALLRWLKQADYRYDPVNALFFLSCQKRIYEAIKRREEGFSIFETVMRGFDSAWCERVNFLQEDGPPFEIGGVEHSNHGHRGPNGTRGAVQNLTKVSSKMTVGHMHSCAIQDGLYVSGTTSKLDLGYNKGPSSWSHSLVAQYANGKRAIITIQNGRWRLND